MNSKNIFDALSGIDSRFITQAAPGQAKKSFYKRILIAAAACICLFAVVFATVSPYRIYTPTASNVEKMFGVTDSTNRYTEVRTKDISLLVTESLPTEKYLPVYKLNIPSVTKKEFEQYIEDTLPALQKLYEITVTDYTIKKTGYGDGTSRYSAVIKDENKRLSFSGDENISYYFSKNTLYDGMTVNGSSVTFPTESGDGEIKDEISQTVSYLNKLFGKNYGDMRINREYAYDLTALEGITVYLYNADEENETAASILKNTSPCCADYITLKFEKSFSGKEMYLKSVNYTETPDRWNKTIKKSARGKTVSPEQAEELLEKGYVFGGHVCTLCMSAQDRVDFSDYDTVGFEYVIGADMSVIPFYTFYKYLHTDEMGIETYAKTYVPAIEITGWDEYFQNSEKRHGSFSNTVYDEVSE